MEKVEKVTMSAIRDIAPGATVVFLLPDSRKIYSAQALVYRAQRVLGQRFSCSADHEERILKITREL